MNGFCLECHFILKKCWFEVGQSMFKHPVDHLSFAWKQEIQGGHRNNNLMRQISPVRYSAVCPICTLAQCTFLETIPV